MTIYVTPKKVGAFEVEIWDRHVSLGTVLVQRDLDFCCFGFSELMFWVF